METCGRKETCGGLFSSGAGDSDWRTCATHQDDQPYFMEVDSAQLAAQANGDPIPATLAECRAYNARAGSRSKEEGQ